MKKLAIRWGWLRPAEGLSPANSVSPGMTTFTAAERAAGSPLTAIPLKPATSCTEVRTGAQTEGSGKSRLI